MVHHIESEIGPLGNPQRESGIPLGGISGPFTFGAAKEMAKKMGTAGQYDILILDVADVPMVDSSASMAIEDVINQAHQRGLPAFFVGLTPLVTAILEQIGVLKLVAPAHRFAHRLDALTAAMQALYIEVAERTPSAIHSSDQSINCRKLGHDGAIFRSAFGGEDRWAS